VGQTSTEKIAQQHAIRKPGDAPVQIGDYLTIRPAHVMTHDNTSAVLQKFTSVGAGKVANPQQPVFTLDHNIQDESETNLAKYRKIAAFADAQGIRHYPAKSGIGHQMMLEEGFVMPGGFVVASDSHSNIYGALSALGTPVVRTDAAAIWATGETWWQVPQVVQVHLTSHLPLGVTGKDVILTLCGSLRNDDVLNCALEFSGPGVSNLSITDRMTISNMTTEWGALTGIFPFDDTTREFLLENVRRMQERGDDKPEITEADIDAINPEKFQADSDAMYARRITLDLSSISPVVNGPDEVKTMQSIREISAKRIRIDKAYILSCVNGRLQDFHDAAKCITEQHIAEHVELYIAAASAYIQQQAEEAGYWQTLIQAGATPLPPGCGPCIGLGAGTLGPNEIGISATNRNFKGRMGDRSAQTYLAAPAVVAASAVAGYIAGPEGDEGQSIDILCEDLAPAESATAAVDIAPGMPEALSGRLLFISKDNMNTDGIYGKEATYRDDLTPGQMAAEAFNNYDPDFQNIIKSGDIILGGFNFGCGSSREQAATALMHAGVSAVLAGSFSQTYKRNAFNNGLLCIECAPLLLRLRESHSSSANLTMVAEHPVCIDIINSSIDYHSESFPITPISAIPQALIAAGGLENSLRQRFQK
jgi:homoaconitate hydratase